IDRPEQVGGILNVSNRNLLKACSRVEFRPRRQLFQNAVIIRALGDRLFENSGIRRYAPQAIFLDKPLQFAGGNQIPSDVVKPYRLSAFEQCSQWIRSFRGFQNSSWLHDYFSLSDLTIMAAVASLYDRSATRWERRLQFPGNR